MKIVKSYSLYHMVLNNHVGLVLHVIKSKMTFYPLIIMCSVSSSLLIMNILTSLDKISSNLISTQ